MDDPNAVEEIRRILLMNLGVRENRHFNSKREGLRLRGLDGVRPAQQAKANTVH